MSNENNKMQVDIENLFKQNVNDLSAIKELYRKLNEVEEKFSQIKYIDSTLANKLKKEYEKLKRIILDENVQAKLTNDIETLNEKLTNDIETIDEKLTNDIETINSQLDTTAKEINTFSSNKTINVKNKENVAQFINSKISEGYRTFCFSEEITIDETIIINNKSINVHFVGVGKNSQIDGKTPTIRLNTGNIGFKCINSNNLRFDNLSLTTKGCDNPSTIAIMMTREAVGGSFGSSQINMIDNVSIWLHDDKTANENNGTIGIYANTVEVSNFNNISVTANAPIVLTKRDIFGLTSNNYNQSMKDISFTGFTNLYSHGRVGLLIDGVVNLNIDNIYIGEINLSNNDKLCGIEFYNYNTNINMNIDCEHFRNVIGVFGRVSNSTFSINALRPKHCIIIGENRNEKGILVESSITKSITWATDETERYDINNTNLGQGIISCIFNSNIQIKNNGVFSNNLIISSSFIIDNVDGTQAPSYIWFKNGEILSNNIRIGSAYVTPSNSGEKAGSLILNTNQGSTQGNNVGWIYNGVNYIPFGQVGYGQVSGNPNGVYKPKQIGEEIFDITNKQWYKSTGLTNEDWKQITT